MSAHATATPFNDAAESRAHRRVLGRRDARADGVVVHPFKAQIGHTLGAAGARSSSSRAVDAIDPRRACPRRRARDRSTPTRPRASSRARRPEPRASALKLSSAFGGANAALVVGRGPGTAARPRRSAYVVAAAHAASEPAVEELAARTGAPVDRLARADGLVRLALAAIARLQATAGPLGGAGVVVGSALATLETNALFQARLRERGARAAEPRRFPYTSPNAVAGECSIVFGLTGPSFSVGGGFHAGLEALAAATVLVEAGDAERIVVVAVDEIGPAATALGAGALRSGAVAVLLAAGAAGARARVGAIELRRGGDPLAASGGRAASAGASAGGHLESPAAARAGLAP